MKRWLRFEDKYGLADIYCAYHGLSYPVRAETVYGDVKIQTQLSNPGCMLIGNNKIAACALEGFNNCVVFFDMDPMDGDGVILSPDWIERKVKRNDSITYAPTVWCAETLACVCLGIDVDELLRPAKTVAEKLGDKQTKTFRDFLVSKDVRSRLDAYRKITKYNGKALSVICDGSLGYTYDEMIDFMRTIERKLTEEIDVLWETLPPSIRRNNEGNKVLMLRELGLYGKR